MRSTPPLYLGLAALSILLLAAFWTPPPVQNDATAISAATHTVTIKYLDTRGPMRRVEVSVEPRERGSRARWEGEIAEVAVCFGPRNRSFNPREQNINIGVGELQECVMARVSMSRQGSAAARLRLPAPNRILSFGIRTTEGRSFMFSRNEMAYGDDDNGDDKDPPKEDPDDPKDPDDPGDDDDDGDDGDEGCSGAADCTGIINPWTCECDEDIVDPWEDERQASETITFGI